MTAMGLSFRLNGRQVEVKVSADLMLVDVLRDVLGLTGTKVGCREGECGACTVLLDGEPVNSCILPAFKTSGRSVVTIEGLEGSDGKLDIIQDAFTQAGASQCGFCTPGMILNAKALLNRNPNADDGEIRKALSGVLCRCTGYQKILDAVKLAARKTGAASNK